MSERDRDAAGRPRNARPRDRLGRPLPRVEGASPPQDPPALPPAAALAHAQELLDDDRPFEAHEVLEAVWKSTEGPSRNVWRGLAQLCVALTHVRRGNLVGATRMFARAAQNLRDATGHGLAVAELAAWANGAAAAPAAAAAMPRLPVPTAQAADDLA